MGVHNGLQPDGNPGQRPGRGGGQQAGQRFAGFYERTQHAARLGQGQRLGQGVQGGGGLALGAAGQRQQQQALQPLVVPAAGRQRLAKRLQHGQGGAGIAAFQPGLGLAERQGVFACQLRSGLGLPLAQQQQRAGGGNLGQLQGEVLLAGGGFGASQDGGGAGQVAAR